MRINDPDIEVYIEGSWISLFTPGSDGIHCWDLNENGTTDADEDINDDLLVNVLDCIAPQRLI